MTEDHPDQVLRLDRLLPARPGFAFALWQRPDLLSTWWGPEGFRLATCEIDFRPGGAWRFLMAKPDESHWIDGIYHQIAAPHRLVFSYHFREFGIDSVCSVAFAAEGQGTRMRFCQTGFPKAADREDHAWGWGSSFGLLETALLRLHGIGAVYPDLPEAKASGVARDLEAARQAIEAARQGPPPLPPSSRGAG